MRGVVSPIRFCAPERKTNKSKVHVTEIAKNSDLQGQHPISLASLFERAFSVEELEQFASQTSHDLANSIQWSKASLTFASWNLEAALQRRNLINESFFDRLCTVRPGRSEEIAAIRARFHECKSDPCAPLARTEQPGALAKQAQFRLVLKGVINSTEAINKLQAIFMEMSGDRELRIEEIREGSIVVTVRTTPAGYKRILDSFEGEGQVEGLSIEDASPSSDEVEEEGARGPANYDLSTQRIWLNNYWSVSVDDKGKVAEPYREDEHFVSIRIQRQSSCYGQDYTHYRAMKIPRVDSLDTAAIGALIGERDLAWRMASCHRGESANLLVAEGDDPEFLVGAGGTEEPDHRARLEGGSKDSRFAESFFLVSSQRDSGPPRIHRVRVVTSEAPVQVEVVPNSSEIHEFFSQRKSAAEGESVASFLKRVRMIQSHGRGMAICTPDQDWWYSLPTLVSAWPQCSFKESLERGVPSQWNLGQITAFLSGVLKGVRALHSRGICHGNIAPSSIFSLGDAMDPESYALGELGYASPPISNASGSPGRIAAVPTQTPGVALYGSADAAIFDHSTVLIGWGSDLLDTCGRPREAAFSRARVALESATELDKVTDEVDHYRRLLESPEGSIEPSMQKDFIRHYHSAQARLKFVKGRSGDEVDAVQHGDRIVVNRHLFDGVSAARLTETGLAVRFDRIMRFFDGIVSYGRYEASEFDPRVVGMSHYLVVPGPSYRRDLLFFGGLVATVFRFNVSTIVSTRGWLVRTPAVNHLMKILDRFAAAVADGEAEDRVGLLFHDARVAVQRVFSDLSEVREKFDNEYDFLLLIWYVMSCLCEKTGVDAVIDRFDLLRRRILKT